MQYIFEISTALGIVTGTVESYSDFTDAPFLVKGFRSLSSSTCDPIVQEEFWNIVKSILEDNNVDISNFVEVLRAYQDDRLLGTLDMR